MTLNQGLRIFKKMLFMFFIALRIYRLSTSFFLFSSLDTLTGNALVVSRSNSPKYASRGWLPTSAKFTAFNVMCDKMEDNFELYTVKQFDEAMKKRDEDVHY